MKANALPLLSIFETKTRLEVPIFQRQYVWNQESHWEPLWEDIERKFSEYLEGRKESPVHFLGAMVLDQKQTPITHVGKRQVIDGQQRLTTLQIFLAGFRDYCARNECSDLAGEIENYVLNKGMMADPKVECFKIWPTQLDRKNFAAIIGSGSLFAINALFPLTRKKGAHKYDSRPRMVEAYVFYYNQIQAFFEGSEEVPAIKCDVDLPVRIEECFQALRNALFVVVIDLEPGDDAQIIFETLNARGEPLLPVDLLRNYIFLRAAKAGEPEDTLYQNHWKTFDEEFWREEVKQGRLFRPRSDLFLQHFLASKQTRDIPVKHLFVEYKFWIEKELPFKSIEEEVTTLARQAGDFKRIVAPSEDDPVADLMVFLDSFDIRTVYPLLLFLFDRNISNEEWKKVAVNLKSYLLRRAVCKLSTKNYNRTFLQAIKPLRADGATSDGLTKILLSSGGASGEWPSDEMFSHAWITGPAYGGLNNQKLTYILGELNQTYLTSKHEALKLPALSVEHLMPQSWREKWLMSDGSPGLSIEQLVEAGKENAAAGQTEQRDRLVQTFGNLTIVTQPLNSALSNGEWNVKRPALLEGSLLPINSHLHNKSEWTEDSIKERGKELLRRAQNLWPKPAS